MARLGGYTYDPQTKSWSPSGGTTTPSASSSAKKESTGDTSSSAKKSSGGSSSSAKSPAKKTSKSTSSNKGKSSSKPASSGKESVKASTGDSKSSEGKSEKRYNKIVIKTLEGNLSYVATAETITLKAGDTVTLEGFGGYLSGNYYVKSVERNISSQGYSHTAVVIRTDWGDSLKDSTKKSLKEEKEVPFTGDIEGGEAKADEPKPVEEQTPAPKEEKTVASDPQPSTKPERTYTVKKGDCLWNIAKKYYGAGKQWNKIYDANTGKIVNPNLIYPGQKFIIP